jgi:hypothetical protein
VWVGDQIAGKNANPNRLTPTQPFTRLETRLDFLQCFLHKTKIFSICATKLGNFKAQTIFSYATNTQA